MKKATVINDLSSFGNCSLTAAIAVLSAMGHRACPVPTAVLSAQSEFPVFFGKDLTEIMPEYMCAWKANGETFDGLSTGYFANSRQLDDAMRFIDTFRREGCTVLVDPVMGDNGRLYPVYDRAACEKMKRLVEKADVITPNVTELCLLTGGSYAALHACDDAERLAQIETRAKALAKRRAVIVTGIPLGDAIGNLAVSGGKTELIRARRLGESFSGTGDIFSAVTLGCLLHGDSVGQAAQAAARFVEQAIADTVKSPHNPLYGVNFEKFLSTLQR